MERQDFHLTPMRCLPWYRVPDWDMWVHCSGKAGSQSLLVAILDAYGIPDPGMHHRRETVHRRLVDDGIVHCSYAPRTGKRLQIVRDPAERFLSLWNYSRRPQPGLPALVTTLVTQGALLEYIAGNLYGNVHWCPQSTATPYATELVRLEDSFLGKENTSSGVTAIVTGIDYRCEALYRMDRELYNQA